MKHDPLDISAQEEAHAEAAEQAKQSARIEKDDLVWLMSSKRGRRIIRKQLERAGVWRLSFNTNALQMAFNEGLRNEGLALTAKLMAYCPDNYTKMMTESREDE